MKRASRCATIALALLASVVPLDLPVHAGSADQAAVAAPAVNATPKVEFEKYTLPNGLQVILHVIASCRSCT